ncbi:MAG: hypothetical protein F6K34_04730, partial [Okeania sp. SIO4D6]|nr:hypothetical protein [Okeania sp. SIO4D6]
MFIFCTAKSIVNSAIISRLVFRILANKPETVLETRRILASKMWSFFLGFFLLFLTAIGIVIGVYLGFVIVGVIVVAIIGIIATIANINLNIQENVLLNNPATVIVFGLLMIVLTVSFYYLIIRLLIRFFILELPLAVEEDITAAKTLGRSWELTKGYVGRIFMILIVAGLITIPVGIIIQFFAGFIQSILTVTIPTESIELNFQLLLFLMGHIISLL